MRNTRRGHPSRRIPSPEEVDFNDAVERARAVVVQVVIQFEATGDLPEGADKCEDREGHTRISFLPLAAEERLKAKINVHSPSFKRTRPPDESLRIVGHTAGVLNVGFDAASGSASCFLVLRRYAHWNFKPGVEEQLRSYWHSLKSDDS